MVHRPRTISIKDISTAVDQAVKLASEKHKVRFGSEFRIGPGTIIGRQLLSSEIELKQAEQIATEITKHVTTSQASQVTRFEPAVLIRSDDGTTCGMIPCEPGWELR